MAELEALHLPASAEQTAENAAAGREPTAKDDGGSAGATREQSGGACKRRRWRMASQSTAAVAAPAAEGAPAALSDDQCRLPPRPPGAAVRAVARRTQPSLGEFAQLHLAVPRWCWQAHCLYAAWQVVLPLSPLPTSLLEGTQCGACGYISPTSSAGCTAVYVPPEGPRGLPAGASTAAPSAGSAGLYGGLAGATAGATRGCCW
jgi:hypothetical protein